MLNIIVCIKQVPETTEVKINPETNTLIREGVKSIINPFDMYAIEAGVRIAYANHIHLGKGVYLDRGVYLHALPGGISISPII